MNLKEKIAEMLEYLEETDIDLVKEYVRDPKKACYADNSLDKAYAALVDVHHILEFSD